MHSIHLHTLCILTLFIRVILFTYRHSDSIYIILCIICIFRLRIFILTLIHVMPHFTFMYNLLFFPFIHYHMSHFSVHKIIHFYFRMHLKFWLITGLRPPLQLAPQRYRTTLWSLSLILWTKILNMRCRKNMLHMSFQWRFFFFNHQNILIKK